MSVKVTLEFANAEQAIVALGKLAGVTPVVAVAPVAPAPQPAEKPARKPRADAGQPRGPYKDKSTEQNAAGGAAGEQPSTAPATAQPSAPQPPVASEPAASAGTPAVNPAPTAVSTTPAPAAAAPVPTLADVQKAVEQLFTAKGYDDCSGLLARFGVKRGQDLPEDMRANFIGRAQRVAAGLEAV